jgi:hypothetical protein
MNYRMNHLPLGLPGHLGQPAPRPVALGSEKERDNASRATLRFPTAVVLGRTTKMEPATALPVLLCSLPGHLGQPAQDLWRWDPKKRETMQAEAGFLVRVHPCPVFFYCSRYRQEMCSDGNGDIKLIDEHLLTHFLAFFGLVPRCRLKLSLYLIRGLARSARGVG